MDEAREVVHDRGDIVNRNISDDRIDRQVGQVNQPLCRLKDFLCDDRRRLVAVVYEA